MNLKACKRKQAGTTQDLFPLPSLSYLWKYCALFLGNDVKGSNTSFKRHGSTSGTSARNFGREITLVVYSNDESTDKIKKVFLCK